MAVSLGLNPLRRRKYRTLSLLCDDEPLSDAQLKAYQTRLQEYRTFLDAVSRLALCGNVCVTEEAVTIGEHGLLTGESLNALQHAGAISVYNTLQQNNWEFSIAEDGEVAVIKTHNPIPDEFLDSEKPIRSDWPAIHISECFVDGERAKIHGSVRPLRTFLPPTVVFRNAADVDEDIPEPELNVPSTSNNDGTVELVPSAKGITVKRIKKDSKEVEYIPLEEYYFGRQEGSGEYMEEKGDFRFKCAVCQRIFYSNVKLMSHILGHVDELSQASLDVADVTHCQHCDILFSSAFEYRAHMDNVHSSTYSDLNQAAETGQVTAQSASQLLLQQKEGVGTLGDAANGHMQRVVVSNVISCRICGKETNSELALAHHLQSSHRQREMPYVCRLCLFRSSLFEDILDHFKKFHDNSNHLLCTYCLRIFTPSDARSPHYASPTGPTTLAPGVGQTQVYLQHLRMHQVRHQLRRCPTCRLNFTNKSDYQVHRRLDHKAVRDGATDRADEIGLDGYEATDQTVRRLKETQPHITLMNAPEAGGIMDLDLLRFPENIGEVHCLECGEPMDSDVHKRYLPCSLCRFATCCAVGYNRHVNRVHVYVAGAPQTEPDSGMPMVRPIHFQWIDDEVALLDALNQTDPTPVTVTSQPSARNNNQPVDVVTEENEEPAPSELVTDTDQPKTSPVDLQIDELLHESEQLSTEAAKSTEVAVDQVAEQISEEAAQVLEQKGSPQMEVPIEERSTDNVDVPNKNDESDQSANVSASPTETKTQTEVENADNLTRDIDMHANAVVTVPGVLEDQSEPEASQTNPINVTDQPQSIPACDQQSGKPREVDPASVILRYMASLVDARLFACTHCAASAMNGNSLARHMVEECGANTATLSPDPLLVKARQETEEQYRIQKAQEQQEQTEAGILFESTDVNLTGTELSSVVHQSERPNEDVVMMSVDGDQLASYGFAGSEDPTAFGTHLVTQVGPNGTTIDLTNDNGEIVQQFLIPDDLQLDEGQTLVVIQGEDGQPQLAIVNQADLIDPNSQQMVIQTEDGQANNMLLYSSALDGQHHLEEAVIVGQEEEKENHQYALG